MYFTQDKNLSRNKVVTFWPQLKAPTSIANFLQGYGILLISSEIHSLSLKLSSRYQENKHLFIAPQFYLVQLTTPNINSKSSFCGMVPCSKINMRSIHHYSSYCLGIRKCFLQANFKRVQVFCMQSYYEKLQVKFDLGYG